MAILSFLLLKFTEVFIEVLTFRNIFSNSFSFVVTPARRLRHSKTKINIITHYEAMQLSQKYSVY